MKGKKEVWIGLGILVVLILVIIGIKFATDKDEISDENLKTVYVICISLFYNNITLFFYLFLFLHFFHFFKFVNFTLFKFFELSFVFKYKKTRKANTLSCLFFIQLLIIYRYIINYTN